MNAPARANCGTAAAGVWPCVVVMVRCSAPPARRESGSCPIFSSGSRLAGRVDEAVAHGEQRGLGPGLHPELGVDVLQVGRDGLAAELQLGGDLAVGPP